MVIGREVLREQSFPDDRVISVETSTRRGDRRSGSRGRDRAMVARAPQRPGEHGAATSCSSACSIRSRHSSSACRGGWWRARSRWWDGGSPAGDWRSAPSPVSPASACWACGTCRWERWPRCSSRSPSPRPSRSRSASSRRRTTGSSVSRRPVLDAMQTMPAFVYLVPVLLLIEPGRVPAIIASFIYALPVGIRLTNLGIRQVPHEIVEAGTSVRVDVVAVAAQGAAPAGQTHDPAGREPDDHDGPVRRHHRRADRRRRAWGRKSSSRLGKQQIGRGVVAGVCILLLAVVLDRITQAMGAAPKSMRGPVGMGLGLVVPRTRDHEGGRGRS